MTFDEFGISKHPNHIATYKAVGKFVEDWKHKIDVLLLLTVSILRKYIYFIDVGAGKQSENNYVNLDLKAPWKSMKKHQS